MYPFPESKVVETGAVQSLGGFHFLLPCSDQLTDSQREGMVRGYLAEREHAAQAETRSFLPVHQSRDRLAENLFGMGRTMVRKLAQSRASSVPTGNSIPVAKVTN